MDIARIELLSKRRRDLESRVKAVLDQVSNNRYGSFRDWLSTTLSNDAKHGYTVSSAFLFPLDKRLRTCFFDFIASNDLMSCTFRNLVAGRMYHLLDALQQTASNSLAPRAWGASLQVLKSNMDLYGEFLPKRERKWSIIREKFIKSGGYPVDLAQYCGTLFDASQWSMLKCVSEKPDVSMKSDDFDIIAKELAQYVIEHEFMDKSNKWWTYERYFWAAARQMKQPYGYKKVCESFLSFIENADSLSKPNQDVARRMLLPEIYTRERTMLFAALNSIGILTNSFYIRDDNLRSAILYSKT